MTRAEAVARIRNAGFSAFPRDWSMGATVGCGVLSKNRDEDGGGNATIYMFPTDKGWGIQAPDILGETDHQQEWTLKQATDLAIGLLTCPHLPFRPEDLQITLARCVGGNGSWMDHVPIGLRRILYMPCDGRRKVFLTREKALQEIAFELALRSLRGES